MYNSTTTSSDSSYSDDSKYTVADILSSMASGEPLAPTYTGAPTGYVTSSVVASGVAQPILTPTTLASIEQTFIELSNVPLTTQSQAYTSGHNQVYSTQSGFVPPIVAPVTTGATNMPIKEEYYDYYMDNDEDPEWTPSEAKRPRMVMDASYRATTNSGTPKRRTGPRSRKAESATPEEEERRGVRRERNKQAAAKCRQRRVDLTNTLITEVEGLEEEKAKLENDIQNMQQQKEQLEFLLQAHQPLCNAKKILGGCAPQVKIEKSDDDNYGSTSSITVVSTSTRTSAPVFTVSRPSSLHIPSHTTTAATVAGVPITTPSTGLNVFFGGFETQIDGHTGLTPLTGGPSCASQVQRNNSESTSSEGMSSPTLMAL